jgi:hypothetical protein
MDENLKWQALPDYSVVLRQYAPQIVELSGLVPRMIAELVTTANESPDLSFENLEDKFINAIYSLLKRKHDQYMKSLTDEEDKIKFYEMLRKLFLSKSIPSISICDSAYRDSGPLITKKNQKLRFYNGVACMWYSARDIRQIFFLLRTTRPTSWELYNANQRELGVHFEALFFR